MLKYTQENMFSGYTGVDLIFKRVVNHLQYTDLSVLDLSDCPSFTFLLCSSGLKVGVQ